MEKFIIEGGATLSGEIPVFGAKNHVLKVIPAALLMTGETVIQNVPMVSDVQRILEIIEEIGAQVKQIDDHSVSIIAPETCDGNLPKELVPQLRASIVLSGPMLARYGQVTIPLPGGDNIGKRPINFFVEGLTALGATVKFNDDSYTFSAPDGLSSAEILFPAISVTGTETMMLAATGATGTTVLKNAAVEPEIVALAEWLIACGAKIEGAGTHTITIEGGHTLTATPTTIIPDRIEAGTFIMMAVATGSELTITGCEPAHLEIPLQVLETCGVQVQIDGDTIRVPKVEQLKPTTVVTHEYPGFPTDLQSLITVMLTQANGESLVRETIYDGRLFYTDQLNEMGAHISLKDEYRAIVSGPTPFHGTTVSSPDLRAGLALVIAALIADGTTEIQNIYHIDRGYERIEERLQAIGANITRHAE